MTLVARYAALTDIGLHRKTNEDAYVLEPPLYAVCDGMGGAEAGEVASGIAADTLRREVAAGRPLPEAAQAANAAVYAHANEHIEHTGMGTTLTAVLLQGDEGRFAHVGDSRAYLLRDGQLRQLTDDHSLVAEMMRDGRLTPEEAAVHPHRSILSRALGTEPGVHVDDFVEELRAGDVLLLCSDGLCGVVGDDAIRKQLGRADPEDAVRRLIQEARKQGGPDNITAVVVRLDEGAASGEAAVEELGELEAETAAVADEAEASPVDTGVDGTLAASPAPGSATRPGRADAAMSPYGRLRRRLLVLAVVLAVVVLVAFSGALVMSLFYYVGVEDGQLAVFSGLPVSVGPLRLHAVYRLSPVPYRTLSPAARGVVDQERVGTRGEVLTLAAQLGMWP